MSCCAFRLKTQNLLPSMSFRNSRLRFVDNRTRIFVSGYVNTAATAKNGRCLFPKDIKNMILLFLFEIENFIKCGKAIIISEDGLKATIGSDKYIDACSTVYGKFQIDFTKFPNDIYKWKFHIQAIDVSIGITSDRNHSRTDKYAFPAISSNSRQYFYALGNGGLEFNDCDGFWGNKRRQIYSDGIEKGDNVEMILNLHNRTMSFHINDKKDLGIAYTNIDISKNYCMCICVQCLNGEQDGGDYVELIDFTVEFSS